MGLYHLLLDDSETWLREGWEGDPCVTLDKPPPRASGDAELGLRFPRLLRRLPGHVQHATSQAPSLHVLIHEVQSGAWDVISQVPRVNLSGMLRDLSEDAL